MLPQIFLKRIISRIKIEEEKKLLRIHSWSSKCWAINQYSIRAPYQKKKIPFFCGETFLILFFGYKAVEHENIKWRKI